MKKHWKDYNLPLDNYSNCETVKGSFRSSDCTIGVIVREGRLKNSGVRGKHFYGFEFRTSDNQRVCYRAVSEENARKTMLKDFPESRDWECVKIYTHR